VRSYGFHGLVGREATVGLAAAPYDAGLVEKLRFGLAFVSLRDDLLAAIGGPKAQPGEQSPYIEFVRLTRAAADWARAASMKGIVAYVEAEFADGAGFHAAIVWRDGKIVYGPVQGEDRESLNAALRLLGVAPDGGSDESSSVGLIDR
jgi:hypothetical protein